MKKTIIAILLVSLVLLFSCTNDIKDPKIEFKGGSWKEIFEEYWTVMDEEYVHFSYEKTDWDGIYKEYAPLFSSLDYSSADDCFTAFGYFNRILLNLSDYHYRLTIETGSGYTYDARPSFLEKWERQGGNADEFPNIKTVDDNDVYTYYSVKGGKDTPYTYSTLRSDYADKAVDGYSEVRNLGSAFHNPEGMSFSFKESGKAEFPDSRDSSLYFKFIIANFELDETNWFYGVTDNGVLYIYFSKFVKQNLFNFFYGLYNYDTLTGDEKKNFDSKYSTELRAYNELMKPTTDEKVKKEQEMITTMCRYATYLKNAINTGKVTLADNSSLDINGIVIDLRCNGGGYAAFFQDFMGLFFASDKIVGYTQSKIGYSRYDVGPWVPFNLGCYNSSLTEDYQGRVAVITNGFSVSCSELTTITSKLIPSSKRFGSTTYGGTCGLISREIYHSGPYEHGSLSVRTTTVRYKAFDGTSYESVGITPDVPVELSTTHDSRFEKAVNWVATGNVQ